jgi:hypothetical protein
MGHSSEAMELSDGGMVLHAGLVELPDGGRARYDGETELYDGRSSEVWLTASSFSGALCRGL